MLLCPTTYPKDRRCDPTQIFLARSLQWFALEGSDRRPIGGGCATIYRLGISISTVGALDKGGALEARVHDLRAVLCLAEGGQGSPSAANFDNRTLQSMPESGCRAGYDGAKRRKGNKIHLALDTLGHLLALLMSPVDEQDRAHLAEIAQRAQTESSETVENNYVDNKSFTIFIKK